MVQDKQNNINYKGDNKIKNTKQEDNNLKNKDLKSLTYTLNYIFNQPKFS